MIILHKERAEHTQILMSPTRPIRLQLQRPVSGLLYKDLWVHFLNTRERLFIFHQVRVVLEWAPCLQRYQNVLESYGGHYAPVFSEYIESQNARAIPGAHNISLETVLIGNGWYNPLIQVSFSERTPRKLI